MVRCFLIVVIFLPFRETPFERHILKHGVESWSGVEPWSGVVFLELVFWSQFKSFKVRDD